MAHALSKQIWPGTAKAALVILVASTALSSCSSAEAGPDLVTSAAKTRPTDGNWSDAVASPLPLEAVLVPSEADYQLLDRAVDDSTARCMSNRGYDYEPYPARPPTRLFDLHLRYAALTEQEAASSGYRTLVPTGGPTAYLEEVDRIDREREAAGQDYLSALYGPNGDGGCRAEGSIAVWSGPTGLSSVPGFEAIIQLSADSFDRLLADAEASGANAAWSECMNGLGYAFDSWIDAPARFLTPGSSVSQQEIDQAKADVRCKSEVGLVQGLFDAEFRIQTAIIEDEYALIDEFTTRMVDTVINVAKVDAQP